MEIKSRVEEFIERLEKVRWGAFIIERDGECKEDTFKVSIGRVMCWIVFGFLSYMWLWGLTIPETMITAFYVLVSYNLTKKFSEPISKALGNRVERKENKNDNGDSK